MYLIGDVHGHFDEYEEIVSRVTDETIQLGDFGIGFPERRARSGYEFQKVNSLTNHVSDIKNKFIRGNHDNPEFCRMHPNYLGDFGVYNGIFFVSGAFSIDRGVEVGGIKWWEDEELSTEQCYAALDLYEKEKPKIVISHECPTSALSQMKSHQIKTRTNQFLEALLQVHQPDDWYYGHFHNSYELSIQGTRFHGVNTMEIIRI